MPCDDRDVDDNLVTGRRAADVVADGSPACRVRVPDLRVCEARRATLSENFDELHAVLNPEAALATRQQKIKLLTGPE
jgi:hypothetical protein